MPRPAPFALLLLALVAPSVPLRAQTPAPPPPATIDACYVPASGTIYRVDTPASPAPGAPKACLSAAHVRFTWNQQGPAGPAGPKGDRGDAGAAAALPTFPWGGTDLTTASGLMAGSATGTTLGTLGAGTRLLWSAAKGALRAGSVDGDQWNDGNVGPFSAAFGRSTLASGTAAFAAGDRARATGHGAVALGVEVTATSSGAVALGTRIGGVGAGSFAFSDGSTLDPLALPANNQFLVRATNGIRLRTSIDLGKGCDVDNQGNLSCTGTVSGAGSGVGPNLLLAGTLGVGQGSTFGGSLLAAGTTGAVPATGAGTRFMWVPARAALRAGMVEGIGTVWDDASLGANSIGLGTDVLASGPRTFAAGDGVSAKGYAATALGQHSTASGDVATALGFETIASGIASTALGYKAAASGARALAAGDETQASGDGSVALGSHASTNGKAGAFVFGDRSTTAAVNALGMNEFLVRAAGGVRLRTSSDLTKGCNIDGDGNLACTGSVTGLGSGVSPNLALDGTLSVAKLSTFGGSLLAAGTTGDTPASGAGTRFMWVPAKGALRAGHVTGSQWDVGEIGTQSTAFGEDTKAGGTWSLAAGSGSSAGGHASLAAGVRASASGYASLAFGYQVIASGNNSIALGGVASTNGMSGAFVYGDATSTTAVAATAANQFVVRAQRLWLGTNNAVTATAGRFLETSTGAYLSTGGTWTNTSDVRRKTAFRAFDGETVLARLAALPIRTWQYRADSASVRHAGPTAQDFRRAFALGADSVSIATVDADGVALVAAQALERRTRALAAEDTTLRTRLARVEGENAVLRAQLAAVVERLGRVEAGARVAAAAVHVVSNDAVPNDAVPIDAVPIDAVPIDAVSNDAVLKDAVLKDAVLKDAVLKHAASPDAAPTRGEAADAAAGNVAVAGAVSASAPSASAPSASAPSASAPSASAPSASAGAAKAGVAKAGAGRHGSTSGVRAGAARAGGAGR